MPTSISPTTASAAGRLAFKVGSRSRQRRGGNGMLFLLIGWAVVMLVLGFLAAGTGAAPVM